MMISGSVYPTMKIACVGKPTQESTHARGFALLKRLVALTQSNDRLVADLATAQRRLAQAIDYASDSRSRASLGAALVVHARKKKTMVATQLRANRVEALALLAELAG